ncbi:hypothetical protein B0H13DRAFT_1928268 [Mycena leptocephala]|nr:hypothetical protein B0H13DRAFT_1928268 [Mycena leptocephala]
MTGNSQLNLQLLNYKLNLNFAKSNKFTRLDFLRVGIQDSLPFGPSYCGHAQPEHSTRTLCADEGDVRARWQTDKGDVQGYLYVDKVNVRAWSHANKCDMRACLRADKGDVRTWRQLDKDDVQVWCQPDKGAAHTS